MKILSKDPLSAEEVKTTIRMVIDTYNEIEGSVTFQGDMIKVEFNSPVPCLKVEELFNISGCSEAFIHDRVGKLSMGLLIKILEKKSHVVPA